MQRIRWSVVLKGQTGAVYIGEKEKSSALITTPSYNGRISQVGNAGITLRNVKTGDTGKYHCEVDFGQLRILSHQPDMVVVGKCLLTVQHVCVDLCKCLWVGWMM